MAINNAVTCPAQEHVPTTSAGRTRIWTSFVDEEADEVVSSDWSFTSDRSSSSESQSDSEHQAKTVSNDVDCPAARFEITDDDELFNPEMVNGKPVPPTVAPIGTRRKFGPIARPASPAKVVTVDPYDVDIDELDVFRAVREDQESAAGCDDNADEDGACPESTVPSQWWWDAAVWN